MRLDRNSTVVVTITAICLAASSPSAAQDYARSGFYAGAGVLGGSYTAVDDELEDALRAFGYLVDVDTDASVGFELYAGYRFQPNLSLEAEFEMLTESDIDIGGLGTVAEIESWTVTANAKVFPLTGQVQPFFLLGIGAMGVEIEDTLGGGIRETGSGFAARFGGGIDLYATENFVFSLGVDYVLPTGDVEDLDYVSYGGGVQYRF